MRILYGVQATGNGHISRARALIAPLQASGAHVDFVFSGRTREALFDMEPFGAFRLYRGLSFVTAAGHIQWYASWQQLALRQLLEDIKTLDTRSYDLVLSDFEPVTAWAARRQGTPCIGLGHQYAFLHNIPKAGIRPWHHALFRWFAPAPQSLGLHWHHFDAPLLPPLLHISDNPCEMDPQQVLVYLPFEALNDVLAWLKPLQQFRFMLFHPAVTSPIQLGHIACRAPDLQHFKRAFAGAEAVLSNAGFELISEALQQQKRILVKPLLGQPEQLSNAKALQQLALADTCIELSSDRIMQWLLHYQPAQRTHFTDVATAIPTLLKQQLELGRWPQFANLWPTAASSTPLAVIE